MVMKEASIFLIVIIPLAPQIYCLNFISEHSNPCWQAGRMKGVVGGSNDFYKYVAPPELV